MPFRIIRGTYHVRGYSPDGDSIRFMAHDEARWNLLSGPPAKFNARRHAQLRLEAIDTLETHFGNTHQPLTLAIKALDFLLHTLGITGVRWDELRTVVTEADDGVDGHIIARAVEKNRRPVAFVYAGAPPEPDGASIFLDADRVRQSLNYQAIEAGLAYPTYYKGLFSDLREAMSEAVRSARDAQRELWAEDRTNRGFRVQGLQSLSNEHVILPKLFRRLAEYLEGGGSVVGFKKWLEVREEGVWVLPAGHFTHFDTVIEEAADMIRMTESPENLIFEG